MRSPSRRAISTAVSRSLRNLSAGRTAWSLCREIITASASTRAISQAARTRTGPVPLARGSTMNASSGRPVRIWMGATISCPVRTRRQSMGTRLRARSRVSTTRGSGPPSGRSCLGRDSVLSGQKRRPAPPARMVAHTEGPEDPVMKSPKACAPHRVPDDWARLFGWGRADPNPGRQRRAKLLGPASQSQGNQRFRG